MCGLTCEHRGHQSGEHEEQHGEEEEPGVTQNLLGLVPDAQVEQTDQNADPDVGRDPQVGQHLRDQSQHVLLTRGSTVFKSESRGGTSGMRDELKFSVWIIYRMCLK